MRSIIKQGEIITDFEKNELAKYKKDLKIKLSLTIPFTFTLVIYYYFFPVNYINIIYLIAFINVVFHVLFVYLHQYFHKLKFCIFSRYLLNVFYLIQFLLLTNILVYLYNFWEDYFIIISLLILIVTIFLGKELSNTLNFNSFVKVFPLEHKGEKLIIDLYHRSKPKSISTKQKIVIYSSYFIIPFAVHGLLKILHMYEFHETHIIIGIFLSLFITISIIIGVIINSKYLFFIINYERKQNAILYTRLLEYILLEDDINHWRRSWKSLKPIKINSILFNGDVTK